MDEFKIPSLHTMLEEIARCHGATVNQLRGPMRRKNFVLARAEFCRAAVDAGHWSTVVIGRVLNRDHTTVLHHAGRLARNA